MNSFSVIVPVYNEIENIEDCLNSILEQNGYSEIVVIDDGSTDGSSEILTRYEEKHESVRVFHQENRGYSYALNRGLSEALRDVVVCIDADCVLKRNSFEAVSEAFKYPTVGAFFGKVKVRNDGIHPTFAKVAKQEDESYNYGGAFMAFRKEILPDGFSTEGGGWSGTDDEVRARVEKTDWKVVYSDEASVRSEFPTGLEAFKNKWNSGITYIRYKLKHPENFDLKVPLSVGYVFSLIGSGVLAIFSQLFLWVFIGLLGFGIAVHTKKAVRMAKIGKWHYFFTYYLYGFASDIVRAFGLLTVFDDLMRLTFNKIGVKEIES